MTDDGIKSIALHRSVIKHRDITSQDPYADYNADDPSTSTFQEQDTDTIDQLQLEEGRDIMPHGHDDPADETIVSEDTNTTIFAGNERFNQENTDTIYNHFDTAQRCEEIDELISSKFDSTDGKLYIKV
jgi:hypothetical protein